MKLNNKDLQQTRSAVIETTDSDNRTVTLAFSSETPVERFFGTEVLGHEKENIRFDRLQNGGAVLLDHDIRQQIGVVESVSLDPDKKGRAVVRFSRSTKAQEVFDDIVDGIRQHVSVGYSILDYKEVAQNERTMVRVTDWEPYEISIVSVPADTSVGIGRSQEDPTTKERENTQEKIHEHTKETNQKETKPMTTQSETPSAEVINEPESVNADALIKEERQRMADITQIGKQFNRSELATQYINDGKSIDQFRHAVMDSLNTSKPIKAVGMRKDEIENYSFMKAIRSLAEPNNTALRQDAKLEFELSHETAKRSGKSPQGLLIPNEVLAHRMDATRTFNANTDGQPLIANELRPESFIESLRSQSVLMGLVRTLKDLTGDIQIPRQIGESAGYWVATENAAARSTQPEFDQIELRPKTVAAYTDLTRRVLLQSSLDIEALVRQDLALALAQTIDVSTLYGSGANGQPFGLVNQIGVLSHAFANPNPGFSDYVEMESQIASENALVQNMAYLMHPVQRGAAKTATKFPDTDATIWEQGNTINGYSTVVSTRIRENDVFFGNFADVILGMWGGLDLTVDPYSLARQAGLRLVVFQDVDVAIRHPESFCFGRYTAPAGS